MRIVIPTTGSLGDVQPYVALGLGLQRAGHRVRVATHADFESFVRGQGVEFFPLEGNSRTLHCEEEGRKMVQVGRNPFAFLRYFGGLRRRLMHRLMARSFRASEDADALVATGTAVVIGHSVAEKLGIPVCSAYLQPMGPSRFLANSLLPHLPSWVPMGAVYNLASHYLVGEFLWQLLRSSINRARQEILGLPPLGVLGPLGLTHHKPVLHAYSPAVIPRPPDWGANNHLTGYWFLGGPSGWKPPARLLDFLASGPAPVFVGFGSMSERHPEQMTDLIVRALRRTRQRGVLLTGWGGLGRANHSDQVFLMEAAPHDWLFPRMAAVVHHGGAGTTAAGLRAGVPSVVVPYMADQPFWGRRVYELGLGPRPIPRHELTAERLAAAIQVAVHDAGMRQRAAALGRRLRAEDGVARAVEVIEDHLGTARPYAFRLSIGAVSLPAPRIPSARWARTPVPTEAY